ncbi:MAG: hypothetical protein LBJ21_05745 [Acidobacteriota bacterium]|jgi:hypothetical protein|nr:hypothetical protein [Acidobacteriota bacterium]
MAKKWIALNILLLVAAIGLARELSRQYVQFKTQNDPAKIELIASENQAAAKTASGPTADTSMETPVFGEADYYVISERTLFSDLRGREDPAGSALSVVVQPVPPLNPKPVLVSTIMIDGQYSAKVIDPARQQARGGEMNMETRRVGDVYRGYEITSIEAEQMVLENGGRKEVIQINRAARRQQPVRPAAAVAAAQVVRIGGGGGASGAVTVTTTGAAPGRTPQNAARQASIDAATAAARQAQAAQKPKPGGAQPVQMPPNDGVVIMTPETPAQKPRPGTGAQPDSGAGQQQQQQRVIRSPFGDIVRPDSVNW